MARVTRSQQVGDAVAAGLSPEVEWFLESRGYVLEDWQRPLWRTAEPRDVPGAEFDPVAVDHVIDCLKLMRHTQGKWAGHSFAPDAWEVAFVIAPIFGWVRKVGDKRLRIIRSAWVEVPRKNGKGIDVDEEILTADGWKRFGDLRIGDRVHAEDGSLAPVSFVSPDHHLDCFRVTFGDGRSVVCDSDHLWTVWDRYGHDHEAWKRTHSKGSWVTIDTPTLFKNQRCGSRGDTRYSVRTDRVIHRPDVALPVDPYVLGYWLGDGTSASAQFTIDDDDYPNFVRMVGKAGYLAWVSHRNGSHSVVAGVTTSSRKRDGRDSLQKRLRELGVLGNKHVPDEFLLAGDGQRLALLRGLMDSDGTCIGKDGHSPRCEFTATNRSLADAALFLARSLGWKATIHEGRATFEGRDCGPKWRISWSAKSDCSPFSLPRKTARLAAAGRHTRSNTATIAKVERVQNATTRCIQVDHPSHQFLVGRGLIPTHNTTLAAGLGLYLAFADGENGAQVIAAAGSKDQAMNAYRPAMLIAQASPELKSAGVEAMKKEIVRGVDQSFFKAVGSIGDLLQGTNPNGYIADEMHVHKDTSVIDALESGTGAREQPLGFIITTADDGRRNSPYSIHRERVERLCKNVFENASEYGVIFAAAPDDDPFAEATWRRANPGFGVSPSPEFMRSESEKAKDSPANLARFLRLNLNVRTKQETKFLPMDAWDANTCPVLEDELAGRVAFGGLDLSAISDLTSLAWLFPDDEGGYDAIWRIWTPEENLPALDKRTAGNASVWVKQGLLVTTPGNVVDYDWIHAQITKDLDAFDVQALGFDKWNATQLVNDLQAEDAPMVEVRQGFVTMSPALKEVQRLLLEGKASGPVLRHADNAAVRWQVDNLAVDMDPAGNVKPNKAKGMDKIDSVAALVDAMSLAMNVERPARSVYEDRGLLVL